MKSTLKASNKFFRTGDVEETASGAKGLFAPQLGVSPPSQEAIVFRIPPGTKGRGRQRYVTKDGLYPWLQIK